MKSDVREYFEDMTESGCLLQLQKEGTVQAVKFCYHVGCFIVLCFVSLRFLGNTGYAEEPQSNVLCALPSFSYFHSVLVVFQS